MIVPPLDRLPRRGAHRARAGESDWPSFLAGAGAFLVVAAACLFLLARLAP